MEEMIELKRHFQRERWIEVDMAWHEHIYEMSGNPFLISFASLFHSVYHTYFTSITQNEVVKLDLHQAIVDAILDSDAPRALSACQALLNAQPRKITRVWHERKKGRSMAGLPWIAAMASLCRRWMPPFLTPPFPLSPIALTVHR
jgi:DNA-binding FadR family transcriptional regulator